VLKRHEGHWLVLDLVATTARMNAAIVALQQWIDGRGGGASRMWLTQGWAERLSWHGRIVRKLPIEIPCNVWSPGPDPALPPGAWWLTAGDMDFL